MLVLGVAHLRSSGRLRWVLVAAALDAEPVEPYTRTVSTAQIAMESIARRFIDAFNRRDAEDLVALAHPEIEFHPTSLVGARRVYHGHDGLRRWVAELVARAIDHRVRVCEVRPLDERRFVLISEVLLGDEPAAPSAMVATLAADGGIVLARAYLTDEQTLTQVVLAGRPAADAPRPGDHVGNH